MTLQAEAGSALIAGDSARLPDLSRRAVFVLDWDGTLFDSMAIKLGSFASVVSTFLQCLGAGASHEEAMAIYRTHSGKPRREIFKIISQEYGMQLNDTDLDSMSDKLTELNHSVLAHAHLFDDATMLLERLLLLGKTPYISSSVPQRELDHFTSLKLPGELIAGMGGIFGSQPGFAKGPQHLSRVMSTENLSPSDLIVVGDDEADFNLSRAADVDCILVNRDNREIPPGIPAVPNLIELCGRLQ